MEAHLHSVDMEEAAPRLRACGAWRTLVDIGVAQSQMAPLEDQKVFPRILQLLHDALLDAKASKAEDVAPVVPLPAVIPSTMSYKTAFNALLTYVLGKVDANLHKCVFQWMLQPELKGSIGEGPNHSNHFEPFEPFEFFQNRNFP